MLMYQCTGACFSRPSSRGDRLIEFFCPQGYRTMPWSIYHLSRQDRRAIESPVPTKSDPKNVHRSPHRKFQAIIVGSETRRSIRSTAVILLFSGTLDPFGLPASLSRRTVTLGDQLNDVARVRALGSPGTALIQEGDMTR